MTNSFKQKALENQRSNLIEEYETVNEQITIAIDPVIIKRLKRRLQNLEEQINSVDTDLRKLEQEEKLQTNIETIPDIRLKLRDNLAALFDSKELKELCFELDIDYEDLAGESRKAKILDLVAYCERHNLLIDLKAEISRLRPHASW